MVLALTITLKEIQQNRIKNSQKPSHLQLIINFMVTREFRTNKKTNKIIFDMWNPLEMKILLKLTKHKLQKSNNLGQSCYLHTKLIFFFLFFLFPFANYIRLDVYSAQLWGREKGWIKRNFSYGKIFKCCVYVTQTMCVIIHRVRKLNGKFKYKKNPRTKQTQKLWKINIKGEKLLRNILFYLCQHLRLMRKFSVFCLILRFSLCLATFLSLFFLLGCV